MKKIKHKLSGLLLAGLLLGLSLCFSLNAQTVDISTGVGVVGTYDPDWTVMLPVGSFSFYVPASISSENSYFPMNDCGNWISPFITDHDNSLSGGAFPGYYTYKREFTLPGCVATNAVLDLPFVLSDNQVSSILVNGISVPLPATPISTNVPGSLNEPITVIPNGLNTILVTVYNIPATVGTPATATGLKLCGNVQLTSNITSVPTNLSCHSETAGQVLSWSPYSGATSYEVKVIYNDPLCCENQNLPPTLETSMITTNNSLVIPSQTDCYSWSVQAIFSNGCRSVASEKICSCPSITCTSPSAYACEVAQNSLNLSWNSISTAQGYEIEVTWNDPDCCYQNSFNELVIFTNTYSVQTNNINIPLETLNSCFSWRVRTQCTDGSHTDWGPTQCSCSACEPPTEWINCEIVNSGISLSWNNIGSLGYEVAVTWNDPICCNDDSGEPVVFTNTYSTQTNNIVIPMGTFTNCFSWKVRTQCAGGNFSAWGPSLCSCSEDNGFGFQKGNPNSSNEFDVVEDGIQIIAVPNPANTHVEFRLETPIVDQELAELTIVDLNKRIVYSSTVDLSNTIKISVQDFPEGMYLFTIKGKVQIMEGKFVVNH